MAAGHDLYALNDIPIPSKGQVLVETGIAIGLPKGTYGRLASRSGLATKEGIEVGAGVIDADYTGELRVLLVEIFYSFHTYIPLDNIVHSHTWLLFRLILYT